MLAAIIAGVTVLAGALVMASPAHAYGRNFTYDYILVDTGNCHRVGGSFDWKIVTLSDGCFIDDSADGTFFRFDPGGVAIKIEVYNLSGAMVAKEEFHPYGEVLWVYDTLNDNDTVYTWLVAWPLYDGPNSAVGTSATIDYATFDFDLPEEKPVELWIYDDAIEHDYMFSVVGGEA